MKVVVRGFTKDELYGSFVYFIFSKELVYIGETQKIAFSRWVQHFYKSGNFTKKVRKHGVPGIDYFKGVNMISVELDDLYKQFPEIRWQTMTRAIEHAVHEQLYISQKDLIEAYYDKYQPDVNRYKIISETTNTKPSRISSSDWGYARTYSKELLNKVYKFL